MDYLQQLDLLHTVKTSFAVHHLEDLNLLQSHRLVVVVGPGSVDHTELPLPNLLVYAEARQGAVRRVAVRELQELGGGGAGLVHLSGDGSVSGACKWSMNDLSDTVCQSIMEFPRNKNEK